MKVIFIKDQPGGGKKGQVKEVSEGFASNFLIPKGFAQIATKEIQVKLEKEQKEAESKKNKILQKTENLKQDMEKRIFTVFVKVGDKGQVFSGVHAKEVALVLTTKLGLKIEKTQVELSRPIKELGNHKINVKLPGGVIAKITINIEPLNT